MATITEYACDYLAGYNNVPIGVLDSAEFKAEVRRLSGPPTPRSAGAILHMKKQIAKLEKYLATLPKKGADYRYNYSMLEAMKRELP